MFNHFHLPRLLPLRCLALPRYLYHATTQAAAEVIMQEGLLPRGQHSGRWNQHVGEHLVCSKTGAVYLYPDEAEGKSHAEVCIAGRGQDACVLQIDTQRIDHTNLLVDHEAISVYISAGRRGSRCHYKRQLSVYSLWALRRLGVQVYDNYWLIPIPVRREIVQAALQERSKWGQRLMHHGGIDPSALKIIHEVSCADALC